MNSRTPTFISNGANLTPADVARIARSPLDPKTGVAQLRATMSPEAKQRVNRSRAIVDGIVDRGEVVYGITTGFGAFKDRLIPRNELAQLQVNLIMSQCVGVGPPLPIEVVRAMMLCRAHTLSLGYSGIRLQTLQLLYDMLNSGVHPLVPEQGSVGASGDLAPLSHMALAMLGQGRAEWRGQLMPASEALRNAGLQPAVLQPKEGLALSNGTSLMSGLLSLALVDAQMLADTADVVGAMTLEALQGIPDAFDPRIHAARGQPGQIASAAHIRHLTEGSTLLYQPTTDHRPPTTDNKQSSVFKVQDAYSLRCMPQVHGACRDTIYHIEAVLAAELNGASDNPLVFDETSELPIDSQLKTQNHALERSEGSKLITDSVAVLSGGNFHGAPLSVAADFLSIGLCQLANISERRQARLVDPAAHGLPSLPAFLIENGGLNSGFMMVQYTAAALASENKSLAHPASVDTIPTSANTEDHVSMGPIAARHARAIVANTTRILALEALMAAQALDFRLLGKPNSGSDPPARMGVGTHAAYDLLRDRVPFLDKDQDFQPYISAVTDLVTTRQLASVVQSTTKVDALQVTKR
jgi:histidine ammonia-lyase